MKKTTAQLYRLAIKAMDGTPAGLKARSGIVIHDCPWDAVAVEVEGGYMVFESPEDFKIWNNQK